MERPPKIQPPEEKQQKPQRFRLSRAPLSNRSFLSRSRPVATAAGPDCSGSGRSKARSCAPWPRADGKVRGETCAEGDVRDLGYPGVGHGRDDMGVSSSWCSSSVRTSRGYAVLSRELFGATEPAEVGSIDCLGREPEKEADGFSLFQYCTC